MTEHTTLVNGGKLTQESWDAFVAQMKHDCVGPLYAEHATGDVMFVVKERHIQVGFDPEYTDNRVIQWDDSSWYTLDSFMAQLDDDLKERLQAMAVEAEDARWDDLGDDDKYALIDKLDFIHVYAWTEHWNFVGVHLTRKAAEEYVAQQSRKCGGRRRELVIFEEFQPCRELTAIRNAIMSGRLELSPEAAAL